MDTESEWWETKSLLPFSAPTTILICGSTQSTAYDTATRPNFGYLHVCLEPTQNKDYQLRSNIVPGEDMVIYQPL